MVTNICWGWFVIYTEILCGQVLQIICMNTHGAAIRGTYLRPRNGNGFTRVSFYPYCLLQKQVKKKRDPQVPESLAPELEAIKRVVCLYFSVDKSDLLKSRRGRFNEPRSMAIYLGRMLRKENLLELGSEFGLVSYSSVSSVVEGMGKQKRQSR